MAGLGWFEFEPDLGLSPEDLVVGEHFFDILSGTQVYSIDCFAFWICFLVVKSFLTRKPRFVCLCLFSSFVLGRVPNFQEYLDREFKLLSVGLIKPQLPTGKVYFMFISQLSLSERWRNI